MFHENFGTGKTGMQTLTRERMMQPGMCNVMFNKERIGDNPWPKQDEEEKRNTAPHFFLLE